MMWNKQKIEYNPYPVENLVGKLLSMVTEDETKIQEVLSAPREIVYSKADCVLKCVERLKMAKEKQEKVLIAGDYDCDGVCSTGIMKYSLDQYGIKNGYYIPDRVKEGYGLQVHTVELAKEKGYSLILTVDNGVKAFPALEKAKELGIEVIVTDHHQIEEPVPVDILVHPTFMEKEYRYFSGAGVALEISYYLIGEVKEMIALAGVAALGDVMPPFAQTRTLIQKAVQYLQEGCVPALQKLVSKGSQIDVQTLQFTIIPKLNSLGRMSHLANVNQLVKYLLTKNEEAQNKMAKQIDQINQERKKASQLKAKELENKVQGKAIEVLYDPDLLEGICGQIAGRITNQIKRPCLVLTKTDGDIIKGSGRSVPGVNLFEALKDFAFFESFGGHEQACGLSVSEENFSAFQTYVANLQLESQEDKGKDVLVLEPEDLSFKAVQALMNLEPYPSEWKEPLICIEKPDSIEFKAYSSMQKYSFKVNGEKVEAILYANKGIQANLQASHFIGTLSINSFRNQEKIQMVIEDLW
ncbi:MULTISPECIES: DHH family phosphoesterase [Terrabacteria group]|uniref:DHH family phosphoesterase n=1 Tax=Bacillati TaxID=1783272 RepID=UPI001C6F40ED|nr:MULTISPECIES: DHH family phosphoesterase [Terrabacteria group]MBW9212301.1 DHH family phosphoesterase [Trueperella sp. zg.1013]